MAEKKQITSRKRVVEHGEVFTNPREVNAMLDLVNQETVNIDSTFFEPACGDGNFLIEILARKMLTVNTKYKKSEFDYEKNTFLAVSSLYGVDILEDNIRVCQKRLLKYCLADYKKSYHKVMDINLQKSLEFVLERNILCGDALTLLDNLGNPIVFSEWKFCSESLVKRRDFRLDQILSGHEEQISIFMSDWKYDSDTKAMIPTPIRDFELMNFKRIFSYEQ